MCVEITQHSSVRCSCFHSIEPFPYLWMFSSQIIPFIVKKRCIDSFKSWSKNHVSSAELIQKVRTLHDSKCQFHSFCLINEFLFKFFFLIWILWRLKQPFVPWLKKQLFKLPSVDYFLIPHLLSIQWSKSLFQTFQNVIWPCNGLSINLNSWKLPALLLTSHGDFFDSIRNFCVF